MSAALRARRLQAGPVLAALRTAGKFTPAEVGNSTDPIIAAAPLMGLVAVVSLLAALLLAHRAHWPSASSRGARTGLEAGAVGAPPLALGHMRQQSPVQELRCVSGGAGRMGQNVIEM